MSRKTNFPSVTIKWVNKAIDVVLGKFHFSQDFDQKRIWIHRRQFSVDFDVRRLVFRLRHYVRRFPRVTDSQGSIKTVWVGQVECGDIVRTYLWVITRRRTLDTKIQSKRTLEASITTSFGRIVRGRFLTMDIEPSSSSKLQEMSELDQSDDLGLIWRWSENTRFFWLSSTVYSRTTAWTGTSPTVLNVFFLEITWSNGPNSEIRSGKPPISSSP